MSRTITTVAAAVIVAAAASGGVVAGASDDPAFSEQWNLAQIRAEEAWARSRGAGAVVAVIDSGAVLDHEDLVDRIVGGTDCIGSAGDADRCHGQPDDDDGHGTHVAGVIAATAGNRVGLAGVAPEADLLIVRALRHSCAEDGPVIECVAEGSASDTRAAIDWAVENGADIVNLSLADATVLEGGTPLAAAITRAWDQGVIVVAAAGNEGDIESTTRWGDLPLVVVTATTSHDVRATYANGVGGARWGVAAPGGAGTGACPADQILSAYASPSGATSTYACLSGTSMAAPHVSGGLALLIAAGLSPPEAIERVLDTAADLGDPGADPVYGAGRLDLGRALTGSAAPGSTTGDTGDGPGAEGYRDTADGARFLALGVLILSILGAGAYVAVFIRHGERGRARTPGRHPRK